MTARKRRVAIVGGGLTGLSVAYALSKARESVDVRLFEASSQLGGNIRTIRRNAFVIDAGPDSWVATKPHLTRLAREIGLGDELIGTKPDTRKVYIVWGNQLHPMPEGLVLGVPTMMRPFVETELLTLDAKLRAGLDWLVPKKTFGKDDDESIASFLARRIGPQIGERIAGPLLGGIFAGDPELLSVRACAPQLVAAEDRHGSLIRAMRAEKKARVKASRVEGANGRTNGSTFLSLERGMGDLVVNLVHRLQHVDLATNTPVRSIARRPGDATSLDDGRWIVETSKERFVADDVILAIPAHVAARLTHDVDPSTSSLLAGIDYASTATVFFGFREYDVRHPLDSVGFLVPKAEGRPILACTFVSSKWEHRAPAGQVLMRVFIGGASGESLLSYDDADLVRIACKELASLMHITRAPVFSQVFRFDKASPQMHVGHLTRMRRLQERLDALPGLFIGGNGYVGTGMPDAVRQGEEIAARILGSTT